LEYARRDIESYNRRLLGEISRFAEDRFAKIGADVELLRDLRIPLIRREDADRYIIPVKRRSLRLPASQGSSGSEPHIDERDFEEALRLLRAAGNALERSPNTTLKLTEEEMRDIMVVFLNGYFEGQATGETFNAAGRGDIVVRAEDRNVFVAECKIYDGRKTVDEAINQVLDHSTWRDSKAVLLLLIPRRDVTTAVREAIDAVSAHENYVNTTGTQDVSSRSDFVYHARGDPSRLIHLTLLPVPIAQRTITRRRRPRPVGET
jgi:hypothetical protein